MGRVDEDHFTAFIYRRGSSIIDYGDSMHKSPARHILPILQWVFLDIAHPSITAIKHGTIAKQSIGRGGGSCGIAAYNFIELAAKTRKRLRPWSGSEAQLFRDAALEDLIRFHYLATQSDGTFSDWTTKVLDDDMTSGVSADLSIATGYTDFNMFIP
ncbi:hypothetical protein BDZ97DRAFT_1630019, partial [Flammula alnicola]